MPGLFADDPDREPMRGIGAGEPVEHKHVAPLEMAGDFRAQLLEMLARHRLVDFAPPDARFARRLAHYELVARRAARPFAGEGHERTGAGETALIATQTDLHKPRDRQVMVD